MNNSKMGTVLLSVKNILKPQILAAEKDFLVVYKPPRMHSAPLAHSSSDNLFDWCTGKIPEIANLSGRRRGEGGLLHRLDFETQGLLLIARTMLGMEVLIEQQKNGNFVKEYSALASSAKKSLPGFPKRIPDNPIKSAFRAYGFGRKAVRPVDAKGANTEKITSSKDIVFDGGKPYVTEILETSSLTNSVSFFRLRIFRGFRHQIRCHLAWFQMPILNDGIYGGSPYGKNTLGLRAYLLSFNDPSSGRKRTYSIPPLDLDDV